LTQQDLKKSESIWRKALNTGKTQTTEGMDSMSMFNESKYEV